MARIEQFLISVLSDLARGLREMNVGFCIVGALVPELLLDTTPRRMTSDADATVVVESRAEFERLKDRLADFGFGRTGLCDAAGGAGGGESRGVRGRMATKGDLPGCLPVAVLAKVTTPFCTPSRNRR